MIESFHHVTTRTRATAVNNANADGDEHNKSKSPVSTLVRIHVALIVLSAIMRVIEVVIDVGPALSTSLQC